MHENILEKFSFAIKTAGSAQTSGSGYRELSYHFNAQPLSEDYESYYHLL